MALQEALLEEREKLEAAIQKELKGKGAASDSAAGPAASQAAASAGSSTGEASAAAADAQEDALDAFMSDVQHQIEEDKVLLRLPYQKMGYAGMCQDMGSQRTATRSRPLQQHMLYIAWPLITAKRQHQCPLTPSLLSGMQVATLQKEVADVNKQIVEAERMLKFADPGEHTPSSFLRTSLNSGTAC